MAVFKISLKEIGRRYGSATPQRQFLFERLQTMAQWLHDSGQVKRIYLFGSFLTSAPMPNDVDLFVVMASGFTSEGLKEPLASVFSHERCRIRYTIDVFWVTEAVGSEAIEGMVDVFSSDRSQRPQGIVEVTLE